MHIAVFGSQTPTQAAGWPGWLTLALAAALVFLVSWRVFRRPLLCAGFVLSISAAAGFQIVRLWHAPGGALQDVARICAVLALLWTAGATVATPKRDRAARKVGSAGEFVGIAHVVALLLGVVTAIIQSMVLAMRMIYVAVDLINDYPHSAVQTYGFGPAGLWSLGFLLAACVVASVSTGDRRLGTCSFCSAVLMASWACLLAPAVRSTPVGGYERTGNTLLLLTALSILVMLTAMITRVVDRNGTGRPNLDGAAAAHPWPGLSLAAAVIVLGVLLLVCYHLAVPIAVRPGGFRLAALVTTGSAALTAAASFVLVTRWWSANLADAATALTSFALCGLATLAVPSKPQALTERYPLVFNAMIVGLATGAGLWTWLACAWERQRQRGPVWTTAVKLIPCAKRFSFFCAALALVVSAMMALWPRWPTVSATDDSLGRVAAGVAANLFLLLVVLWCSRRSYKLTFQTLTVLAVVSTTGFLLARMLPFTSQFR